MKTKQKQKQVSIEEYVETYCQEKRIRERFAVYVNQETHLKLRRIARMFASEHYTTTSSLADSIISRHFDEHRELLNNTCEEYERKALAWLREKKSDSSDEPEGQPEEESEDVENKVESVE